MEEYQLNLLEKKEKLIKKLFSHTLVYGLASQITLFVNFLVLPIITKDLTDVDFGISGTLTAYTVAISAFSVLGLRVVLTNSFFNSPNHYKWRWRQIYGFLNIWNIVYIIFLGIIVYYVVPDVAINNRWEIVLLNVLPFLVFSQAGGIGRQYYQLNQKPFPIALRSLIFGILLSLLNVLFISYYKMGYMGWFYATSITLTLTNISYWYALNRIHGIKPIYNFKRKYLKKNLKVGLPTIPHYYGGYLLSSSDRLVMDQLGVSVQDIGKYNASNTFGVIGEGFSMAIGWVIGPLLTQKYKEKKLLEARDMVFITQITFFLVTFIPSLWMKELFQLLIKNEDLVKVYPLAIVLFMSFNYRPMYFGSNAFLFYHERTQKLWRITIIAGGSNLILNVFLIPVFGFEVAAITTFVCYLYMGYAGFFLKVFKELNNINYYPIIWFLITISLAVSAYILVEFSTNFKLIISAISILIGVFFIFKFNNRLKKLVI